MRVLISGAAGFIASHLVDYLLADHHEVIGVDNLITGRMRNIAHLDGNPRFTFIQQDVTEPLKVDGPLDRIYHLATPASPVGYTRNQILTLKTNSQGTWNLLDLSLEKSARFLLGSSSEIYGHPSVAVQREDYWGYVNALGLRSMYDESKRFAESCTIAYHRERGADTRIVRIFNTYGPRMDPHDGRLVPTLMRQALNNEPITVYGDGGQTRSICYVADMVRGIALAMECEFHEPINLGNPEQATVLELAREIRELVPQTQSQIVHKPPHPEDPKLRCPDITRAKQTLGWSPKVQRKDGLGQMLAWYQETIGK